MSPVSNWNCTWGCGFDGYRVRSRLAQKLVELANRNLMRRYIRQSTPGQGSGYLLNRDRACCVMFGI